MESGTTNSPLGYWPINMVALFSLSYQSMESDTTNSPLGYWPINMVALFSLSYQSMESDTTDSPLGYWPIKYGTTIFIELPVHGVWYY